MRTIAIAPTLVGVLLAGASLLIGHSAFADDEVEPIAGEESEAVSEDTTAGEEPSSGDASSSNESVANWGVGGKEADGRFKPSGKTGRLKDLEDAVEEERVTAATPLKMGGPGIEHFTKSKGQQATPKLDYSVYDWESEEARRRSIYRVVWRGIADPFMEALDFPDLGLLAPKRAFSISALQSLAVFNNDFVLHASEWLSQRVRKDHDTLERQVDWVVELAWLRRPDGEERNEFIAFTRKHGLPAFCRLLLNSNEFLFVE